jgi:hypothetical protein
VCVCVRARACACVRARGCVHCVCVCARAAGTALRPAKFIVRGTPRREARHRAAGRAKHPGSQPPARRPRRPRSGARTSYASRGTATATLHQSLPPTCGTDAAGARDTFSPPSCHWLNPTCRRSCCAKLRGGGRGAAGRRWASGGRARLGERGRHACRGGSETRAGAPRPAALTRPFAPPARGPSLKNAPAGAPPRRRPTTQASRAPLTPAWGSAIC